MSNRTENLASNNTGARLSNFELLRTVSMLFIVANHFSVHGGFQVSTESVSFPQLWLQFTEMIGRIGVNVFVLISGYFLINSLELKISKIIKLWLQLLTYSLGVYIILVMSGLADFSAKELIKSALPVTFVSWWYASTYFVLFLLSPFINKLLRALDRKAFQRLLISGFILWCIIPTLTNQTFQSNRLLWFIFLYSVGAYIHLWHEYTRVPAYKYFLFTFAVFAFAFSLTVILDIVSLSYPAAAGYATHFYDFQYLQTFVLALGIFLVFKSLNIGHSKVINTISSATFGVYLLHENPYVRPLIWQNLFNVSARSGTVPIFPYSLAVIFAVFIGCTCVELVRIYVLERNYMKFVYKLQPSIERMVDRFLSSKLFDRL